MDGKIVEVSKNTVEIAIEKLLRFAYEGLKAPTYTGYPSCDLIACFLDAKERLGDNFDNIFNKAVPEYKGRWELFQRNIIEPRLDDLIESLSILGEDPRGSHFDDFSDDGVIPNMALASALLMIYGFKGSEENWIVKNKEQLIKSTKLLIDSRALGKGWPYHSGKGAYMHTLPTWLSMAALYYMPKGIGDAIVDGDWKSEFEKIKVDVKEWLVENIQRENSYCSWSFKPEKHGDEYNPVATAQAILALYHTGITDKEDSNVNCAIEYIKNYQNEMGKEVEPNKAKAKIERLIPRVGRTTENLHPGIQQCLQVLLLFDVSDKVIESLLNEIIGTVPKLNGDDLTDISHCYATLRPLLLCFAFLKPKILIDSTELKSEFESFISEAKSIILVGEIDNVYASVIPKDAEVTVFCRDEQDEPLLSNYGWKSKRIDKTCGFETINCVIVNEKRALLSSNPFKDMKRYNSYKYLEDEAVSDLINQLEEVIHVEIRLGKAIIKGKILGELSGFPKQRGIMEPKLEEMETKGLQGVLEYYKLIPERSEEALASALGLKGRRAVESEFSRRGIFSRAFVTDALKNLLEKSVGEKFTPLLVFDESSVYLLLNTEGTKEKEKVIECCSECLDNAERLFVTSDVYGELIDFLKDKIAPANIEKIRKIEEGYESNFDALDQPDKQLHFTKNEKIAIVCAKQGDDYGIITNSWEVAEMCKVNNIKTFSIMKFFEERKDENIYKIFRVPVDEFRQGETA